MKGLSHEAGAGTTGPDKLLEELVGQYRSYIAQIVSRLLPRHFGIEPSEIEQETTIRLWRSIRNEREIRDFQSYVYRVAATAVLDAIRDIRKRREDPLEVQSLAISNSSMPHVARTTSPEEDAGRKELIGRIRAIVEELQPNRRRAVKLHLQGFTSEEIAQLCGWSEPKARNLTYRGMDDLREKLREAKIDHEL